MNEISNEKRKNNSSVEMKYSSTTHWSYGIGGFFTNFILVAMGVRLIFFYENILLLNIILIGIALTILGFWNMINNPLMGYLSDKRYRFTKKWGRRFPWFVVSAISCCFSYLLIFTVPFHDTWGMFFWLLIITCIFELLYSIWNTNYIALFPEKFRNEKERTKVGGINTIAGQFGVALGILIPPFLIKSNEIKTYIYASIVVMLICLANALLMIPGMREDKELRSTDFKLNEVQKRDSFLHSMKYIVKQKNLSVFLYVYLAHQVLTFLMLASLPFWTVYIVKSNNPTGVETILASTFLVSGLISVPFWIKIGRKYGNRKGFIYGTFATSLCFIPLLFFSDLLLIIITIGFLGFGIGSLWTLMFPCFSDVIDENVLITNKRQEGIYNGIRLFVGRFATVIQAISFMIVHTLTNYQPGAETQAPLALFGIRVIMALIPMLFYFTGFLVMWKFYDLTPDKVTNNQILLKEKGF
jgi:Na+/melibiose symporter-like transporter